MRLSVAPSIHTPTIVLLGLAALIAWRMYSRIRRLVGRQRLSRVRPWISVCLVPVLVLLFAFASFAHPGSIAALMAGTVLGAALGAYGLRLTKFEQTTDGLFYTPSGYIGMALSLLLGGRVLYRAVELYFSATSNGTPPTEFALSPITLAIFGMLAGHYFAYAIGLLLWRSRASRTV